MRLGIAFLAAAAAILTYQLFVPPIVGLADQGDFVRTIGRFGYGPQHQGALKYIYVEPKYVPDQAYRSPGWEIPNSEYLFTGAALLLNRLISRDGSLDIRLVGLIHALAFLGALARLLWVTRRAESRLVLWTGAVIALTDVGYAAYWNSLYTEPASLIFFLLALAEAIEIGGAGKATAAQIARWSLWSALCVLAKTQNAPLGVIAGLFAFRLALATPSKRARIAGLAGGCVVLGSVLFDAFAVPPGPRAANAYNMVFEAILPESHDPGADLKALGLDPQLARYGGTGAWTAGTGFAEVAQSSAFREVTPFRIAGFYLKRPARLWRRMKAVLPKITFLRPEWYGNYAPSAGVPPAALSHGFNVWSGFHEHVLPAIGKWLVFGLAAWPLVALRRWRRETDPLRRLRIEVWILLPVCTLAALGSAVFGDANDLVKHMYLFNLLLDACLLAAAWAVWRYVFDASRQRRYHGTNC